MDLSVLRLLTTSLVFVTLHSALAADRPGVCPKELPEICYLVPVCESDTDCEGNFKCCFNGCGNVCVAPVESKPGFCPRVCGPGSCVEECSIDTDCKGNLKCCFNGCGHQCMEPAKPEKPGFCPRPNPSLIACDNECCSDHDCKGNRKCCYNGCGRKCLKPCRAKH